MPDIDITQIDTEGKEFTVSGNGIVDLKFIQVDNTVNVYAAGAFTTGYPIDRFSGTLNADTIRGFLVGGGA